MAAIFIALTMFLGGLGLAMYGANKCTQLDVAEGRRDRMALVDDYGSNRGYHFPYTHYAQLGFVSVLISPFALFFL